MRARITIGWSPGIKRLSLIRLLHEVTGYSIAKLEHMVGLLDEDRTHFVAVEQESEDAAAELSQQIKAVGASCEVSVR